MLSLEIIFSIISQSFSRIQRLHDNIWWRWYFARGTLQLIKKIRSLVETISPIYPTSTLVPGLWDGCLQSSLFCPPCCNCRGITNLTNGQRGLPSFDSLPDRWAAFKIKRGHKPQSQSSSRPPLFSHSLLSSVTQEQSIFIDASKMLFATSTLLFAGLASAHTTLQYAFIGDTETEG